MREIKQVKCVECNNEYYDDQETCPFCGHTSKAVRKETLSEEDFFHNDGQRNGRQEAPKKSNFTDQDIIILVVLGIFFWPAALIYLLVKMKK